jgi:hypothetical protein
MRALAVPVTVAALALLATPAPAQERLTPEGPATLRSTWQGAVPLYGQANHILTKWSVTVGPGGRGGFVRLRVFHSGNTGTIIANGQRVWLPAEPGTYEFPAPHVSYDGRFNDLGIDQEAGGHAIVKAHENDPSRGEHSNPYELNTVDVFRPPLADNANAVPYSERRKGESLSLGATVEPDIDEDSVGDRTEEVGDLTAVRARITGWKDGWAHITARVRNNGTTVRHIPHIARLSDTGDSGCLDPLTYQRKAQWLCPGPAIGPGEEADVMRTFNISGEGSKAPMPTHVTVASEGPDTNAGDNTVALTPNITLASGARTLRGGVPGVGLTVSSDAPATVLVAARIAGVRIARTLVFTAAGAQTVRLEPRRRADRRRINRALRRRGRLTAIVTAAAGRGVYATRRVALGRR